MNFGPTVRRWRDCLAAGKGGGGIATPTAGGNHLGHKSWTKGGPLRKKHFFWHQMHRPVLHSKDWAQRENK